MESALEITNEAEFLTALACGKLECCGIGTQRGGSFLFLNKYGFQYEGIVNKGFHAGEHKIVMYAQTFSQSSICYFYREVKP